ncbi:MAG: hypothetical protein HKN20_03170 [Gemmatimonadetes bacterium]|nr:hypothetical protein [Gemmatimonadota bacterium]
MFGLPRILAVLLAIHVALFAWHSLGFTRHFSLDSMNYVDVARNIGAGRGITQTTLGSNQYRLDPDAEPPIPFVAQPPLYPIAIAGLARIGLSEENGALLIGALAYGLVLLLSFSLGRRFAGDAAGAVALGVAAIHYPLAGVSRYALSDTMGLMLALLSLLLVSAGGARGPVMLFPAGLAAGLAFATRYALAPFAVAGVFALARKGPRSIAGLLAFLVGFGIPAAVVLVRNAAVSGALMPELGPSQAGLFENAGRMALALVPWLADPGRVSLFAQALVIFVSVALAARFMRKRVKKGADGPPASAEPVALFGTAIVFYTVFLVAQRTRFHFDEIDPRLALPAALSLVLLLAIAFARRAAISREAGIRLGAGFLLLAIGGQAARIVQADPQPPVSPGRMEQIEWIAGNTNPGDWIVGEDTFDVTFLLRRDRVVSFSQYPYTEFMTYDRLLAIRDAKAVQGAKLYLVLRADPELDEEEWRDRYGDFIADLMLGRVIDYEEVGRLAGTPDSGPGVFLVQPKRTTR